MKKFLWISVLACLTLTACGTTVSSSDRIKAERYYQFLPICEKLPEGTEITAVQLDQLAEQFQTRYDNYEQTMYHVVGESSYMNKINYLFEETKQINLKNYSPMVSVLYQHQDEIGMNPVLLMRHVLEGDDDSATEYDNYTDQITCLETEKTKETDLSKWFDAMKKQLDYMKNAKYGANYKSDFSRSKTDGTCITYVSTSLQRLGVIPKNTYVWVGQSGKLTGTAKEHIKKHKNTFDVFYPHKSVKQLKNTLKVGDIVGWNPNNGNHIMVFMGFNKKGNPIFNSWGSQGGKYKKEYSYYANRKVDMVIRLKKTSL